MVEMSADPKQSDYMATKAEEEIVVKREGAKRRRPTYDTSDDERQSSVKRTKQPVQKNEEVEEKEAVESQKMGAKKRGAMKRGAIFISSGDKKENKRRRITSGQKAMDLKQKTEEAEGGSGVRPTGSKSIVCETDTIKRRLLFHHVLGQGSFGTVLLAEDSSSRKHFAVKIIRKRALLAEGDERVMVERRVLQLASGSPFLVHADFAFQTKVLY
ncbi:unnamed protein product [Ranitomeya imitator]|uniref:non-specific serine/threonine protein kinase n=1 Tax=Ranitomeya imitator TaxID=111125 RepID=A0ABN9L2K5_9NEOB|nr:unnamed protein product [Ranitomeya imitator]